MKYNIKEDTKEQRKEKILDVRSDNTGKKYEKSFLNIRRLKREANDNGIQVPGECIKILDDFLTNVVNSVIKESKKQGMIRINKNTFLFALRKNTEVLPLTER